MANFRPGGKGRLALQHKICTDMILNWNDNFFVLIILIL